MQEEYAKANLKKVEIEKFILTHKEWLEAKELMKLGNTKGYLSFEFCGIKVEVE